LERAPDPHGKLELCRTAMQTEDSSRHDLREKELLYRTILGVLGKRAQRLRITVFRRRRAEEESRLGIGAIEDFVGEFESTEFDAVAWHQSRTVDLPTVDEDTIVRAEIFNREVTVFHVVEFEGRVVSRHLAAPQTQIGIVTRSQHGAPRFQLEAERLLVEVDTGQSSTSAHPSPPLSRQLSSINAKFFTKSARTRIAKPRKTPSAGHVPPRFWP
jgi:hypothetical protein